MGSPSSLNLCGDPRGVPFGNAPFHLAHQHSVTLGWCPQWWQGKKVHFAVECTSMLPPPCPVYDPAAQHRHEGSGGSTRNTTTQGGWVRKQPWYPGVQLFFRGTPGGGGGGMKKVRVKIFPDRKT